MSQNLEGRVADAVRLGLEKGLSPTLQGLLGGVLMAVTPSNLSMVRGWSWKIETVQARQLLVRGGAPLSPIPPIQGEKGWLNLLAVIFSDPMSELTFQCDNWVVNWSPFALNLFGAQPSNTNNYITVYNPATPVGPLYGVQWTPSQFWPYNTQIVINVRHPATAPTATSQLVAFGLGRHYIRDEKEFYESVILEGNKLMVGRGEVMRR